jgi:exodeoxyribonuclease V alpha subunit
MRPLIRDIASQFEVPEFSDAERQGLPSGAAHVIDAIDRHYGELPEPVIWATALLLVVLARGGTCLPLDRVSSIYESDVLPGELREASVAQWLTHLEPITHRDTGDVEPLRVVHDSLYFDRYLEIESRIASALRAPLDAHAIAMPVRFSEVASEIFATPDTENLPLDAALGVWSHRSFVLAGGPGTGKTTTVAKFLASLELSISEGERFPRVRLCAPTGKAAQRMREAIEGAIAGLGLDEATSSRLLARLEPTTIHSLLGISPTRPRRRNVDFLAADLVICDETSMVDVALLGELLRALSPATRIVLVG